MDQWDAQYTPLLASNDPGEQPQKGGLLLAQYGKGYYIYTGYAFFRQLPFGVPGAIRLYVNLLSVGHEPRSSPAAQSGTDSRRRPGAGDHAEHDRHDRRGPVHHHPTDHQRGRRPAGDAGLDLRRAVRALRRLVWAELGAAMPEAGGSYHYLKEIYGPRTLGRLLSFLFIWQLSFSAPLVDRLGLHRAGRTTRVTSGLGWNAHSAGAHVPSRSAAARPAGAERPGHAGDVRRDGNACVLVVILLYRRITAVGKLAELLWVGVALAVGWVIVAGLTHFSAARAFDFPPGAFHLSPAFFTGMGSAMLIATYDYWGYYNVCFPRRGSEGPGHAPFRARSSFPSSWWPRSTS